MNTSLPTRELGSTGMDVTHVGFGAWAIGGGGWEYGWGDQSDDDSAAAIRRALELGINWIDTAAVYGFGRSEEVVGRVLKEIDDPPLVFTKASLVEGPGKRMVPSLKRDSIRRELEKSLTLLGVAAIDLYQVHNPEPDADLEEGWETFRQLKDEGLVRHIGVSNFSVAQIQRVQPIAEVETLQPPYSLIDRAAEAELLPFCEEEGIGVIVYSPMGSGLLTGRMTRERIEHLPAGDWRKEAPAFVEPELKANLATAERIVAVAADLGVAPGVVAVAWTLRNPAVDGAIVGLRRPEQVEDLIEAASLELDGSIASTL